MKKTMLAAQKRTVFGRKVSRLRKQSLIPAIVYGHDVKSLAVSIGLDELTKTFHEAGETGLVELKLENEVRPVLIKNIQLHPVTGMFLHVDFYQVNLKEKVKARVPVFLIGIAPAVSQKLGVLLELSDEIEVEALPTDLPEKIEVDIAQLAQVNDTITVAQINSPSGVTILTESNTEIVKIGALVTKEAEAQAAAEEAAAQAAQTTEAAATTAVTPETTGESTEKTEKTPVATAEKTEK